MFDVEVRIQGAELLAALWPLVRMLDVSDINTAALAPKSLRGATLCIACWHQLLSGCTV